MNQSSARALLAASEPPAVTMTGAGSGSPLLLTCDHASNRIPERLAFLGLPPSERERHIAHDIGAREVALAVGKALGAVVIVQNYSRLVIDCNRPLDSPGSIVTESDGTAIVGNLRLQRSETLERQRTIFEPYHRAITTELERRRQLRAPTLLICMHSFTPSFEGQQRPWHIGTLYGQDRRAAAPLLEILRREPGLVVGDNQPYAVGVDTDYTLPVHGQAQGLPHVGIEVRQDLIAGRAGQDEWSQRLTVAFAELARVLQL